MEHWGPTPGALECGRYADGGNAGKEAEGGGSRERGGGRATSTLKQEDWNKRLAWPREGKARAGPEVEKKRRRNRWGRGSVCGCWYGAQSCFAHHLPSSRTQPPFETAVRGPSSGSFAPAVSSTLTCFSSSSFSIFSSFPRLLVFLLLLDLYTLGQRLQLFGNTPTSFVSTSHSFVLSDGSTISRTLSAI